jgi:hypothetical protein
LAWWGHLPPAAPASVANAVADPLWKSCGPVIESYLVNQGPVFSGPGHYRHQLADPEPCCYPYVGPVFSGYPYGLNDSGGYPRGAYSPFVGYPYAEPAPYVSWSSRPGMRRHFYHRHYHRHYHRYRRY